MAVDKADKVTVQVDGADKAIAREAFEVMLAQLRRARQKYQEGSPVFRAYSMQIEEVLAVRERICA